jgi:hypothetical protein
MIVVRLVSGDLLLHSVVALDDAGMAELEAIGRPAYAIVPSVHHVMDAPFYKRRYPELLVLAPEPIRPAIAGRVETGDSVENLLPALGVRLHAVPATRAFEYAYDVPLPAGGRMLMFNDVLGNRGARAKGLLGFLFARLLWVGERPDIPPLYRLGLATDLAALRRFVAALGDIRDLRLATFSHGDPLTRNAAATLNALAPPANPVR